MNENQLSNQVDQKQRASEAWPVLTSCARRNETITYGELSQKVGTHHRAVRFFLEEIQSYCANNKLPPLTILVVNQNGEVGDGFVEWITGSFETDKEIVFNYDWGKQPNPFMPESAPVIKPLKLYEDYSREQVHQIFSPSTEFSSGAGTWGLQGIIPIPDRKGDFVFFVTYGRERPTHTFDESITTEGVLTWQSQPKQSLSDRVIKDFISHDISKNSIYLFLRTRKRVDYTYMGKLQYLSHDSERENPVHFQWQILDWDPSKELLNQMELELVDFEEKLEIPKIEKVIKNNSLTFVDLPSNTKNIGKDLKTREFQSRKQADYASIQRENSKLGSAGEELVIIEERKNLLSNGRADLASQIVHVSKVEGDGAGYDILSYEIDGTKKYIEVKTTKGNAQTDFYISPNELAFSKSHAENYYLYRLYEYNSASNSAKFGILQGDISEQLDLIPQSFRARKI